MSKSCKLIFIFYILLTIMAFLCVAVTTTSVFDILLAVIILWLSFFVFFIGNSSVNRGIQIKENDNGVFFDDLIEKHKILVVIVSLICSFSIAYFYTGQTLYSVIKDFISGNSLYSQYQEYWKINNIGTFSLTKVPFILMNILLNFITIYSIIYILKVKPSFNKKDIVFLVFIILSFWFFGVARGTNFELFELAFVIVFSVFTKKDRIKIPFKIKVLFFILALLIIWFFSLVFSNRGTDGTYITSEIKFDSNKILPSLFPSLSLLICRLSTYFSFGFYYITATFDRFLLNDLSLTFFSFLPLGLKVFGIEDLVYEVNNYIDGGTCWKPDFVSSIGTFGIIGAFLLIYIMARLIRKIENSNTNYTLNIMLEYFLVLQMFSFPIGNFIVVSSPNKIIFILLLVNLLLQLMNIKVIIKNKSL